MMFIFVYSGYGQIPYLTSGSNYNQTFDGILSSVPSNNTTQSIPVLPTGWVWIETGSNANSTYRVDNGTSNTSDFYLLGATNSTERAIGGYSSNNLQSEWGASLINNAGVTLTDFTLTYTGEQWRDGGSPSAVKNVDAFSYSVNSATSLTTGIWNNVTQLNFTALVNNNSSDITLNGNSVANKIVITFTVTGISWAPGQTLWIRWTDPNESGNDDAMGIDDLIFSAAVPTITTSSISPLTYCSGSTVSVPYTKTGSFAGGNVFTAQLSDATGSFVSPINIGSLSSTTSGTITATIPVATSTGTLYRIRVVSSTPSIIGTNNGSNISITSKPTATISYSGSPFCTNYSGAQSVNLTGTLGGTFSSAGGLTIVPSSGQITPSSSTAASYTVTYTMSATGACPLQTATTNITISSPPPCTLGTGVVNVASLPFISNGRTTCGKVNNLTSANTLSCGISNYLSGEDEVFIFTPTSSGNITINLISNGSRTGLMLYDGCPLSGSCSTTSCIGYEQSSSGNKSLCANVTSGVTYYLIVDSWANPNCNSYDINIDAPISSLPGSVCANAITIPSMPYTLTNETTKCRGNDYTNASIGSCGTIYESGEDKVYVYNAVSAECIGITITGANSNSIGFQVYLGCPGSAGTLCVGNSGGAVSGTLSGTVTLSTPGTYYIVVDNQAAPSYVNYNISIASFGAGVTNDLPCNAIPLTLGVSYVGTNTCSSGASEPATLPACWGPGGNVRNTVWFKVVAPSSGSIRARVIPNSLTNPQIALYSGTCGTSMTLKGCSDDASSCGTTTNYSSDLTVSGLIAGNTYFIVVDGYGILTGSFGILAIDGSQPLPPLSNGQDCGNYIQVCDTTMSFGNPGFQSFGNICDFDGSGANCLNAGERGSAWFEVTMSTNGVLEFSIVPKDWSGPAMPVGNETDYDFAVWKTVGTGAVTCADIATPINAVPLRCNYSALGLTGLYSAANGVQPPQYPAGYAGAFSSQINALAGEHYVILVSNYATSTSGFDIIFSNTSPIVYGGGGSNAVSWSGGTDTDWFKKENWGGCAIPSCSLDAIVNGGIILQPAISAPANAKSILINPGATLKLNSNKTLTVCENFTNLGTFNSGSGSTVIFNNNTFNQNIDGNLLGTNAFSNVTITKSGGVVKIFKDVEMKGDFMISNGSSAFSANSNLHIVGGDFTNNGNYLTGIAGILELNGSTPQNYYNFGTLNNVNINNVSASGVTIYSDLEVGNNGILTLTNGRINTTPFTEVRVLNRNISSVTSGNNFSFINGNLRRRINSQGSYNFPVGEASKGYQLANVNFNNISNPTTIDNIVVNFQPYASLPPSTGATDCGINYTSPVLDNGKWNFVSTSNAYSGDFDLTLHNLNYTNAAAQYTIMNDQGGGWMIANGNCAPSIVTAVKRNSMTGLIGDFGTAQGPGLLPIELLSFTAKPLSTFIQLNWTTGSEKENRGFDIQRSDANGAFETIGWINGAGTTNIQKYYQFNDINVKASTLYYYRLHQIDFNGKASYSPIISCQLKGRFLNASVFPNPVAEESVLTYFLENDANVMVSLINTLGEEIIIQENTLLHQGTQHLFIKTTPLHVSDGLYTLKINASGKEEFLKIIISSK